MEAGQEPTPQVKGIWDSVVSWMKMAVDFVAIDATNESLPAAPPYGRVRSSKGLVLVLLVA